jgi:hypothetical protein
MKDFRLSFAVTAICLIAAYFWGGTTALFIALVLGVMEVSLSFDNAVVNATVLQAMDAKWQRRFLTWGILIAVFGMRLLFPIVVVAVVANLGAFEVARLALQQPLEYSHHLEQSHVAISAFGGMFLLLVFLNFILDAEKDTHWFRWLESKLSLLGKVSAIQVIIAGGTLLALQYALPPALRLEAVIAGLVGILLYLLIDGLSGLTATSEEGEAIAKTVKRSGVMAFLYLEVLDASFSFDGVIGAFAITKDVVIITTGLTIGAMFVRSFTIYLVRKGTLKQFVFLEHGAHYGIGALALLMLASTALPISEVITGLIGVTFILAALGSSVLHKKAEEAPVLDAVA